MTAYTDRHRTDDPDLCVVCGEPRYQKHAETCSGRPKPRLHQALGRCWCHKCHELSEALELNRGLLCVRCYGNGQLAVGPYGSLRETCPLCRGDGRRRP